MKSKPRVAVLYAPGTNCHKETLHAVTELLTYPAKIILLKENGKLSHSLKNFTHLIIPGGFSFGDHFGAGRVAALLIKYGCMDELKEFIQRGGKVMGICNGYQILCELGFLPGTLALNTSERFESRWIRVRTTLDEFWAKSDLENKILRLPVAHAEGRFVIRPGDTIYPAMHYLNKEDLWAVGNDYPENPAGSERAIAGIFSDFRGQIFGLMPHPERACLPIHESQDGLAVLKAFLV